MDKQDKKTESPTAPKKSIPIRRSKSEIKTKSKYQNQNQSESSSSRNEIINWVTRKFNGQTSPKHTSSPEKKNKDKNQQKIATDSVPTHSGNNSEIDDDPLQKRVYTRTNVDADEYYMKHPRRGKAIIFNHEHFEKDNQREGTQYDVQTLKTTLTTLKFEIEVYDDYEYCDIKNVIKNLSKEDFTDCDCIAFFLLTHGNNKQDIAAKDVYYAFDKIWEPFCADKCPTLAGKPKLFFVNACRGRKKDSGIKIFSRGKIQSDSSPRGPIGFRIPNNADFLMAYSTAEGYYSYRDINQGTWFIQTLCETLMDHYLTKDLLKILTLTSRKVALTKQSQSDNSEDNNLLQIPNISTMLIRELYFHT